MACKKVFVCGIICRAVVKVARFDLSCVIASRGTLIAGGRSTKLLTDLPPSQPVTW